MKFIKFNIFFKKIELYTWLVKKKEIEKINPCQRHIS